MDALKIALWQTAGLPANVAANLSNLDRTAAAAAAAGAALLLCPECWLCGYNVGTALSDLAETCNGPSARRVAGIARRHAIAIAYGYAERDGGRLFNSVQVIDASGVPLAHYRKTHLFGPAERAAYTPGVEFAAPFDFCGFRVGLLICYDIEFPEPARSLALAGAELLLVPTALTDEYGAVPSLLVPARALENQIFIAYCNHAGDENGMQFLGGSCAVGPDGAVLASAGKGDALLITQIERQVLRVAAAIYPYRADRRPELYGSVGHPAPC
jgi:predicted amidohydrolase